MQSKFLATVIPMTLGAIAIVFGVFEYLSFQRAESNLRERLDSLLTVQSRALSGPIWNINEEQVKLTVDALTSDPDIATVEVYDFHESRGVLALYRAAKPGSVASLVGETDIVRQGTDEQEVIGRLVIGISEDRVAAGARQRLLLVASLAVALMIGIVGSILFSYRRIIDTPLGKLLTGIQAAKDSADPALVEWSSADKMGTVVAAFNDMLKQRAASENDLRLARDELERRVKERTEELAIAARQLGEAIESTSEGFSLFDKDDRLIICNTKYKQMVKPDASAEELEHAFVPGTPFIEILRDAAYSGLISIPPRQESAWIEEQIRQRQSPEGRSVQLRIKDQWIRIAERRTQDGSIVAVYSNVTEMEHARLEAEAANEAKSTFLATMSHEIRTPMNGVLGMLEVLERSQLEDDQRRMIDTITKSANALLGIINDILDFSKIEAGEIEIERTPVQLRDVCESAVMLVAPAAQQKDLDLALIIEPDVASSIYTDSLRLRQILVNLLGNAVKFTTVGSIAVRVRAIPDTVEQHRLCFEVTDTGVGIARDQLAQIFSPFGQAESATTRKFGGTGLGLAISQRLVERMSGSIGVNSVQGEGATFWFTLPIEVAPNKKDALIDELDLANTEALVVTGSQVVHEMIAALLTERGANVRQSEAAEDAENKLMTAALSERPIDLLIIDDRMSLDTLKDRPSLAARLLEGRTQSGLAVCAAADLCHGDLRDATIIHQDRPPTRYSLLRAAGIVLGKVSPDDEAIADPIQVDTESLESSFAVPSISSAIAANQLILVVDDHQTNQEVIQRQLMVMGYASQVAGDGEEALTMWRDTPYALILCDCHMPVLDGFGLTAAIRSAEAGANFRTTIVALTANALAGEADRCFNAGMDDFLSKPVGIKRLRDTLVRWIGPPQHRPSPVSRPERDGALTANSGDGTPFDMEAWARISGNADLNFLSTVVGTLKPRLSEAVDELREFRDSERLTDLAETAHKAAGASASVAATELSYGFRQLESAARGGRSEDVARLIASVETEVNRVLSWELRTENAN